MKDLVLGVQSLTISLATLTQSTRVSRAVSHCQHFIAAFRIRLREVSFYGLLADNCGHLDCLAGSRPIRNEGVMGPGMYVRSREYVISP